MEQIFRPAFALVLLFTLLLGLAYPLSITGASALLFPAQANGSLVERDGKIIGSSLIGQDFRSARYFWPRPSATAEVPYNAATSSGSNLGATSAKLKARIEDEAGRLQAAGL